MSHHCLFTGGAGTAFVLKVYLKVRVERQDREVRREGREERGEEVGERRREKHIPCVVLLSRWLQYPGLGQNEARGQELCCLYPVGGQTQVMGHCFPSMELDWKRGTRTWISNHIRFWHRRWKLFQLYQNAGFCNCFSTGLIVSTIVPYTTNTIRTILQGYKSDMMMPILCAKVLMALIGMNFFLT